MPKAGNPSGLSSLAIELKRNSYQAGILCKYNGGSNNGEKLKLPLVFLGKSPFRIYSIRVYFAPQSVN